MARSLIKPRADRDVFELFEHFLDHSERSADSFADSFAAVIRRLEEHPKSGQVHPLLGGDIRVAHVNRYKATLYYVYTVEDDGPLVSVLRVLRQERDVSGADFE